MNLRKELIDFYNYIERKSFTENDAPSFIDDYLVFRGPNVGDKVEVIGGLTRFKVGEKVTIIEIVGDKVPIWYRCTNGIIRQFLIEEEFEKL